MIVVGITGNLASGKTHVAKVFKKLGAQVFDADVSARRALGRGRPETRAVLKLFGKEFLSRNGGIDRAKLARHVFSHPADLKKLNIIVHPGVIMDCLTVIERSRHKKGILALDVPLLFESKMGALADRTIVVRSSRADSLKRAERRGVPRALALRILASQWSPERKAKLADHVIDNDGTAAHLESRAREIFKAIRKETGASQ